MAAEFGGRLIEAAGPSHEVIDTPRRQQRPAGVGSTDVQIFGSCHDAARAQIGGSISISARQVKHGDFARFDRAAVQDPPIADQFMTTAHAAAATRRLPAQTPLALLTEGPSA